jgi:hypothetical protein
MTKPSLNTVLSQLGKLSLQDLQTIIQTATGISDDLSSIKQIESSPLMAPLVKELEELMEFKVDIPVQLQFRLQGGILYGGPSREFDLDEVGVKNAGKSPFRADTIIDGSSMLDEILSDLTTNIPRSLRPKTVGALEKACPQLAAYVAKVTSFEEKLQKVANEAGMTDNQLYNLLEISR